jgi:F420-0:gamma-glutamyl ligase
MKTYKIKHEGKNYCLNVPESAITKCTVGCQCCHGHIDGQCIGSNCVTYIAVNPDNFERLKKYIGFYIMPELEQLPVLNY